MILHRLAVVAALIATSLLVAAPAQADPEPVVETSGDTITYDDPALDGEDTTTVRGTLRRVVVDRVDPDTARGESEAIYSVQTDDGEFVPLDVEGDLPAEAGNGDVVAEVVDGRAPQLAEARIATQEAAPRAAAAGARHRAYLVKATQSGSFTQSDASLRSQLTTQVLDEWRTESEGAIESFDMNPTVYSASGVRTTSGSRQQTRAEICSMDDPEPVWNRAIDVVDAAVDLEAVEDAGIAWQVIVLVSDTGCGTAGGGTLGIAPVGQGFGVEDSAPVATVRTGSIMNSTGVHELGHNFGLDHANGRPCPTCASEEYLNPYSVMGAGINNAPTALDSRYREYLGVLQPGEVDTPLLDNSNPVETVTQHTLVPRGAASGTRGVKVYDAVTGNTFWIELRQATAGRDAGAAYGSLGFSDITFGSGVTISLQRTRQGSPVVDLIPRENGSRDSGRWIQGTTYVPSTSSIRVNVAALSSTSATVRVARRHRVFAAAPTPRVTGTARVGSTLRAVPGTWSPASTPGKTYQWQVFSAGSYRNISGATSYLYKPTASTRGTRVRVRVTGQRPGYQTTYRYSAGTTTVR